MKSICIIIPAYNEQKRIARTLTTYASYFAQESIKNNYQLTFLVVLNGCIDTTRNEVELLQRNYPNILLLELKEAGKGLAIKAGFEYALKQQHDFVGYVDADMATAPEQFNLLIQSIDSVDGAIASRYMPGAQTIPTRPWIKRWGSRIFYEPLIYCLFGLNYYDYQCGAKLFKTSVIALVTPRLTVKQWAFDVELLYWCKHYGLVIKEIPTMWHDQAGSKLKIFGSGLPMLSALVELWWQLRKYSQ